MKACMEPWTRRKLLDKIEISLLAVWTHGNTARKPQSESLQLYLTEYQYYALNSIWPSVWVSLDLRPLEIYRDIMALSQSYWLLLIPSCYVEFSGAGFGTSHNLHPRRIQSLHQLMRFIWLRQQLYALEIHCKIFVFQKIIMCRKYFRYLSTKSKLLC